MSNNATLTRIDMEVPLDRYDLAILGRKYGLSDSAADVLACLGTLEVVLFVDDNGSVIRAEILGFDQ